MKIVLQQHNGFNGVLRILPIAAHLATKEKAEVFIETPAQYRSILNLVDYAKWKDPAEPVVETKSEKIIPPEVKAALARFERTKLDPMVSLDAVHAEGARLRSEIEKCPNVTRQIYDLVYTLQIHPVRYHLYRTQEPPKRMLDFILEPFGDDFRGMNREIVFSRIPPIEDVLRKYNLPDEFSLACPCGSAQSSPPGFDLFEGWISSIARTDRRLYYLTPRGFRPNRLWVCVEDLAELATLIRHATEFFTLNAAPAVIACARFEKKPLRKSWHHLSPRIPRERFQDDMHAKEQTRWEIVDPGTGERIVRQKDGRQ